ncbi:MAG TPA: aminomethyl-transferring glycine dehydrogenase, partial [Acidimicrobiia bacterium]|nr:aminomethyl-transferring glycine dehydrogenase [Acidimicrobiia bacterium]
MPDPLATSDSREDPGPDAFVDRHIGPRADDQAAMLAALGYGSLDELVEAAVPSVIREPVPLGLTEAESETEALAHLRELAGRNEVFTSLIGLGYHDTITPPVILRNVLENPAWYTAYTPYQPEISQGRLEALLNFQTMVSDLTGMDLANASLLDEGTAAAEAMAMLHRINPNKGPKKEMVFFVDSDAHPQTIDIVRTRAEPLGIEVVVGDPDEFDPSAVDGCFGVFVQFPGSSGRLRDLRPLIERAHASGVLVCVAADLLALALVTPPGEMGADAVVGTTQRFGVPLGFGGPHAAYLAVRDDQRRTLPGRLVGVSIDAKGRTAFRLTLQTREQHIRREKATSNICTAQVLLAVIAGLYAAYHGAEGLYAIARRVHRLTAGLAGALRGGGFEIVHEHFFDTLTVRAPGRAEEILAAAAERRINLRFVDADTLGISLDETTTPAIVHAVLAAFGVDAGTEPVGDDAIPAGLVRMSGYLTHRAFNSHRSEHQMLRYLRRLADRDLALDRTMIPLGSCTMKLNATAEMEPITWPEFGRMHPYAPVEQARGYLQLFDDLERWLAEITGYDAVSLQPNAGSQGEYAGLLAIRKYHAARDESRRQVCLIPASAHGTNAASAAMAGMKVVVVACDERGNVDLDDLKAKAVAHSDNLAALMVTYPSTHGVYEEEIRDICAIVHEHGGQVYLDGANLNALVGVARPGKFGADV